MSLPTDKEERKNIPLARGLLDYFPNALAAVASLSQKGNEQHNAGEDMHWARGKSNDHADCIMRHLVDRGTLDTDGEPHSAKVAWRALAQLEEELIAAGATPGRNARDDIYEGVKEEEKSAAENIWEPAVGDKVRIVKDTSMHQWATPSVGHRGVIIGIGSTEYLKYKVSFDNSTQYEGFAASELVLLGS